jgi:hypothetical protein
MPRGARAVCLALCAVTGGVASAAQAPPEERIQLEVRPRVCTLSAGDAHCDTEIEARWRAARPESLCVLIVGRPEVRRCWEYHSAGRYTVRLVFSEDLHVELRDPQLQHVLATKAIRVIREALELRRKRRPPWSIF